MRIAMIGTGYVGLVSGTCFAEFGHTVSCVDKDHEKIARLNEGSTPIYEPGLEDLVQRNVACQRLRFTTDLDLALQDVDAVFIAVGTPSRRGEGHADLTYVYTAVEEVADALKTETVLVIKSTVPVGTNEKVSTFLREKFPHLKCEVVSNPEFLREGAAIEDFMHPNRVVIGAHTAQAAAVVRNLYRPLHLNETPVLVTTPASAELIKYASNAFLATKISFINEIANLCEACDADVQEVAKGIGLDKRIGDKFLHPGPGYGGSCFPKDTLALLRSAQEEGVSLSIVETVVRVNEGRKQAMAEKIITACGGSVTDKTLAVLGVTFKPNTDDIRESPSLAILPALLSAGAKVRAFDPAGMEEGIRILPSSIAWCQDSYETMEGADALILLTEWNQFRALDLARVKKLLNSPRIIDLRNIYPLTEMELHGFHYTSIGRKTLVSTPIKKQEAA